MDKYIITFEDGTSFYLEGELQQTDRDAFDAGIITIVRLSDLTELTTTGEWTPLGKWTY